MKNQPALGKSLHQAMEENKADTLDWLSGRLNPRPTLRELYAGMAMQGLVANGHQEWITRDAILIADTLIEALSKKNTN